MQVTATHIKSPKGLHYDRSRRRLWIAGQRIHHGATGAFLATTCALSSVADGRTPGGAVAIVVLGAALMAHDWADRRIWFKRGWGTQP
jgi:hypothetical protein